MDRTESGRVEPARDARTGNWIMTTVETGPAAVRDHVVEYLRAQYLGPAGGEHETLSDRPDRVYLVGTLYPRGRASEQLDGDVLGDEGHDDELDEQVELANTW